MKYDCFVKYSDTDLSIDQAYNWDSKELDKLSIEIERKDPSALFVKGVLLDGAYLYKQAANYYREAAEQSYAPAEHYLALCYYMGDGVEESEDLCRYWMSKAAMDGDSSAAYFMGDHYDEGTGNSKPFCHQDDEISTFWYYIGAKMGNKACMNNLAVNLQQGCCGHSLRTQLLAKYWYNKAAVAGMSNAKKFIDDNPSWKLDYKTLCIVENDILTHSTIRFGNYFINNKSKKEPIEWIVCEEDERKMVLISKNALFNMKYTSKDDSSSGWENSDIRKFLNKEFIKEAFNDQEKEKLICQVSKNEINPVFETKMNVSTNDFVTIPSFFDLVEKLNMNEWGCRVVPASFACRFGESEFDEWWLRGISVAENAERKFAQSMIVCDGNGHNFSTVNRTGKIDFLGYSGFWCSCGVRPMIIVKKDIAALHTKRSKILDAIRGFFKKL